MKTNLLKVLNLIRLEGGVSYNLNTGEVNPPDGYMVSLAKHETRVKQIDESELRRYIRAKAHLLAPPNRYLGVWHDGEDYVLDVSELVESREVALLFGKNRKQQAIWDNKHKDEILIHYEEPSRNLPDAA